LARCLCRRDSIGAARAVQRGAHHTARTRCGTARTTRSRTGETVLRGGLASAATATYAACHSLGLSALCSERMLVPDAAV
jgi:hypothetical protein